MTLLARNTPPKLERFDATRDLVQALGTNLCVLDTETTGLARSCGIAELAYIWFGVNGDVESFSCLLNPRMEIPWQAQKVHGISNEMVKDAPEFDAVAAAVSFIFDDSVVSGFSVRNYDIHVLINTAERYGYSLCAPDTLDVRDVWRNIHNTSKGNLIQVAQHYNVTPGPAHEGMGDVITTVRVLDTMIQQHGVDAVLASLQPGDRPKLSNATQALALI